MTDRELMRMALDALDNSYDEVLFQWTEAATLYRNVPTRQARVEGLKRYAEQHAAAIDALRARLAQPEQEPAMLPEVREYLAAFPATQPQRKPLTPEQLLDMLEAIDPTTKRLPMGFVRFARAVEAAHGITGEDK